MAVGISINSNTVVKASGSETAYMTMRAESSQERDRDQMNGAEKSEHGYSRHRSRQGRHHHMGHHHHSGHHHMERARGHHRMSGGESVQAGSEVSKTNETQNIRKFEHAHQYQRSGFEYRQGLGMEVFQQEIKTAVSTSFGENYFSSQSSYSSMTTSETPDEFAKETLVTAKVIMKANPEEGSRSMISFRQKVETSARVAIETVANDDDIADVEETLGLVNAGLDDLDNEAAQVATSSASVLAVEHHERQRSSIRIRTQEGDVVKLSLRQASSTSASDVSATGEQSTSSLTTIDLSERGGLRLSIEGDINESEMAAIKHVFTQAQAIADEFFDGDIAAAFDLAEDFAFDSEQLARVKLGFRSTETTNVAYSQLGGAVSDPVVDDSDDTTTAVASAQNQATNNIQNEVATAQTTVTNTSAENNVSDESSATTGSNVVASEDATTVTENDDADAAPTTTLNDNSFGAFFDLLTKFSKQVSTGFEGEGGVSNASMSYHYSQSFKLEMLKSVIATVAPDDAGDAAVVASLVIDGVASESEVESV